MIALSIRQSALIDPIVTRSIHFSSKHRFAKVLADCAADMLRQ